MLALIAGTGDLPKVLLSRIDDRVLICAMEGNAPAMNPDVWFRIERLGNFLDDLVDRGVTRVCMAGAVSRPAIDPTAITPKTAAFVPRIMQALTQGDDAALRAIISIFEERGFKVVAAHELAPDLLPDAGVLTDAAPSDWHRADAKAGEQMVAALGAKDIGQACIVRLGAVVATEGPKGTAAMLRDFHANNGRPQVAGDPVWAAIDAVSDVVGDVADWLSGGAETAPQTADSGILFKAPKPDQDRRADLPVIGPETALQAAQAGLAGIVIEAGGVMVLNMPTVLATLAAQDMFLWVRPKGDK